MNAPSQFRLERSLLNIGIVAGTLVLSLVAIAKSNYTLLAGLIVLLFVPFLIQSPVWLLMAALALYGTGLTLPQLPASLTLHSALFALLVVWIVIRGVIFRGGPRPRLPRFAGSSFFLFLFLVNFAVILSIRGMGMRFLGSEQWGGGKYFILLLAVGFFGVSHRLVLTPFQWKMALSLHVMGYLLPVLLFLVFGNSEDHALSPYFAQASYHNTLGGEGLNVESQLKYRFPTLGSLGIALGIGALALIPFRMPGVLGAGLFLLAAIASTAVAGHRSRFIILVSLIVLFTFFHRDHLPKKRQALFLLLIGSVLWLVLYLIAPYLPPLIQRTVSVIPGLGISEEAQLDALGTITWRIDLWKFCLSMSESYRWIGRGFLYMPDEMPIYSGYASGFLDLYIHHSYHNGPISFLIDTGIPGLVVSTGFFLAAVIEGYRGLAWIPAESAFGRAYRVFFCLLATQVLHFYVIQGDALNSMLDILFPFAIMKILLVSHLSAVTPAPQPGEPAR